MLERDELQLNSSLSQAINELIQSSKKSHKEIAQDILNLSENYQNQASTTPWNSPSTTLAYLSYFLPLNIIRNTAVLNEMVRLNLASDIEKIIDFGAGPATLSFALSQHKINAQMICVEVSKEAENLFKKLPKTYQGPIYWKDRFPKNWSHNKTTLFCSYSLNELDQTPHWLFEAKNLVIIEPSTQQAGRQLQRLRGELIKRGYSIWAPCLHQQSCPLLQHSQKDWCHDRIHWQPPDWFLEIESHLPIKNQNLTFSYLIASQTPPPEASKDLFRLTGDLLKEKGKTRIMACRSSEREFLSWLKKNQSSEQTLTSLKRGELVSVSVFEKKGNEIRPSEFTKLSHKPN